MPGIRTNMPALFAHRYYMMHQTAAAKALRRLSSGSRINSAADDAAGLAVSEKMRARIRGLRMASLNAQNAISMLQTAEGGLNETHAILQRMRELSVQASNGTCSDGDRALLDIEYRQLLDEIDRIAGGTEYNRIKLLDGSASGEQGADKLDRLLGGGVISVSGSYTGKGRLTVTRAEDGTALLSLQTGEQTVTGRMEAFSYGVTFTLRHEGGPTTVTISGVAADELREGVVSGIRFDGSAAPGLDDITVAVKNDRVQFQVGANGGADQHIGVGLGDMSTGSLRDGGALLRDTDIRTRKSAGESIGVIDAATRQVSRQRASIGATINRLHHTINSLETAAQNLTAAESRIRDADMAQEMMNYARASILMQAAQLVMAHARLMPNTILELLRSL